MSREYIIYFNAFDSKIVSTRIFLALRFSLDPWSFHQENPMKETGKILNGVGSRVTFTIHECSP